MQVPVDVTEEMRREAESRGIPLVDYVDMLISRGRQALQEEGSVTGAIERIRALRAAASRP